MLISVSFPTTSVRMRGAMDKPAYIEHPATVPTELYTASARDWRNITATRATR